MLLNLGCGTDYRTGFVNIDRTTTSPDGKKLKVDLLLELGEAFPYKDGSVDGVVAMHVLQQLGWRDLVSCIREVYRVLKNGGVFRIGCPMVEMAGYDLNYLLGWNNINLFSEQLLVNVFKRVGFKYLLRRGFGESELPVLAIVDNREDRGTWYFDAIKNDQ